MSDLLGTWTDFNVAIVGAAAALGGLVIVAASVNIADIVKSRSLTARLGSGIVMLVAALIVAAVGLMPSVDERWYGYVVLVVALIALVFQIGVTRAIVADRDPRHRATVGKALLGFGPAAAYLAAGVLAISDSPAALSVAAAGALVAIIAALVVSWVSLVEVLR